MHSNKQTIATLLISDRIQQGITDQERIIEHIAGQYIGDKCVNDLVELVDTSSRNE